MRWYTVMIKSPSYGKPHHCCQADCVYLGTHPDQPCWGCIEVVDDMQAGEDDWWWMHCCEGHHEYYFGKEYKPEVNSVDKLDG